MTTFPQPGTTEHARFWTVYRAFEAERDRHPLKADANLVAAVTPGGGSWTAQVNEETSRREIRWGARIVAIINPNDSPHVGISEGEIQMGMRSTPQMDCALRAIAVLAEKSENLELIRELAMAVICFVETPAPERSHVRIVETAWPVAADPAPEQLAETYETFRNKHLVGSGFWNRIKHWLGGRAA